VDGGGDSTDRNTELAILEVLRDKFPGHLVLGEEGGVSGDATSEYLWCIDPLGNN
jgi:myo-inositol-1(or 4)-monophosphatase